MGCNILLWHSLSLLYNYLKKKKKKKKKIQSQQVSLFKISVHTRIGLVVGTFMKLVPSHGVTEHWFLLGIQTGIKVNPTIKGDPNFVYISTETSTMLGTMQTVMPMATGSVKNTRSHYEYTTVPMIFFYSRPE